jgi:hypothetical protein
MYAVFTLRGRPSGLRAESRPAPIPADRAREVNVQIIVCLTLSDFLRGVCLVLFVSRSIFAGVLYCILY